MRMTSRLAVLGASTAAALLSTFVANADAANPPCYVSSRHLYCGNNAPTPIYADARYGYEDSAGGYHRTRQVDTLRSNPSYFQCYVHGERHSGGNDVWYYTNGDDRGAWGYVPAVEVWSSNDGENGVAQC